MAEAERNDPIIPAQACSPRLWFKEGQREGEYSDGKQGLCGSRAVVCQLKRLRGPKLLQCPPPAEFFLPLPRLPFSAFHRTPLCESAAQVQLRLSPHEIKNTEEHKRDRTDEFLEREGKKRAERRRHTQVLYHFKLKEEPKLHLDLFIKAVCIGKGQVCPTHEIKIVY